MGFMYYFSYLHNSIEAFYAAEADYHIRVAESVGVDMKRYTKDKYDYDLPPGGKVPLSLIMMTAAFGLLFRIISCAAMILKDREKKV